MEFRPPERWGKTPSSLRSFSNSDLRLPRSFPFRIPQSALRIRSAPPSLRRRRNVQTVGANARDAGVNSGGASVNGHALFVNGKIRKVNAKGVIANG